MAKTGGSVRFCPKCREQGKRTPLRKGEELCEECRPGGSTLGIAPPGAEAREVEYTQKLSERLHSYGTGTAVCGGIAALILGFVGASTMGDLPGPGLALVVAGGIVAFYGYFAQTFSHVAAQALELLDEIASNTRASE